MYKLVLTKTESHSKGSIRFVEVMNTLGDEKNKDCNAGTTCQHLKMEYSGK